ncbi:type II toxin-antitoxin system VapC family toxin [Falsiroseomonas sp. CW058]|uniref:type II toxin-antitoxin system VapC family toxin n=1 Tax=Falsiroseomonas sp. CW058 TaxID=3388664 RepID=UPI003D3167A1
MPAIVLDTSWVAAFVFADEASPAADALYAAVMRDGIVVPALWPVEVSNMLRQGERRGRIGQGNLSATLAKVLAIPCEVEPMSATQALGPVLDLARRHALTAYDASCLECARRLGLPLATRDEALIRAAGPEGVGLRHA